MRFLTLVHVLQKKIWVLNSGCYLRHLIEEFYYNSTQPIRNSNQGEFGSNEFFHFLLCLSFIGSMGY